ncbi:MAG: quinolinate synthase NadA [Lachnospiraceae bacterium]|nr:quinolinate synthase NadA [Lachnospiraceae bacterium]
MSTTRELQDEIIRLKKEKDICILAHAYQSHDILEVADYIGDSYGLSEKAKVAPQKTMLMCGVRFMAETVKILAPEKKVLLSHSEADCPMARQFEVAQIEELKKQYPDYAVVAYINTTASLKTVCDVCVTSASAVKIVRNMQEQNILFIPDCNLGAWVAKQVPEKNLQLVQGGCPIHAGISRQEALAARQKYPNAQFLVHPECRIEVTELADYIGSTTGIMDYVKNSSHEEFIIGTENSIVQHLQFAYPDKKFYALSKRLVCQDMKLTTLADIYQCVKNDTGEEIILSEEVRIAAKKSLDAMLKLG